MGRDENCRRRILDFLERDLHMEELPTIERVHRLGRYNHSKGPRSKITAFSFYRDTEEIMSGSFTPGYDLCFSRDHPSEIARARQKLWRQFKAARESPYNRVSPAKLIVNGTVVNDMFPDWDLIMNTDFPAQTVQ